MARRPWIVIGCWLALALVVPMTVPSLTEMAQRHPVAILPAEAPSTATAKKISQAFHEAGSENVLIVLLTSENGAKGLGPVDENVYRTLTDRLRQDTKDVVMLQDFLSAPPLRELLASKDGKAWILPVGLSGELERLGQTVGVRQCRRGVGVLHQVVDGLGSRRVPGQPAGLTESGE